MKKTKEKEKEGLFEVSRENLVLKAGVLVRMSTQGIYGIAGKRKVGMKIVDEEGKELPDDFFSVLQAKVKSDHLAQVLSIISEMRATLDRASVEYSSTLGLRYLPVGRAAEILQALNGLRDKAVDLWNDFCDNHYSVAVEEAREKLGERFRESDYPSAKQLKRVFAIRLRPIQISPPSQLQSVDREAYKEAVSEMRAEVREFCDFARHDLRASLEKTFEDLLRALNPGDGTTRKGHVTEGVLKRFNEFYARLKSLAFLDDEKPEAFCPKDKTHRNQQPSAELVEDELPACVVCGTKLVRSSVLGYAFRIRQAMLGIGIDIQNVKKGTEDLRNPGIRTLLTAQIGKLSADAAASLGLAESTRFVKRRKKAKDDPE